MKYVQHKETRRYRKRKCFRDIDHIWQEGSDKRRSTTSWSIQNFCYIKKRRHEYLFTWSTHGDSKIIDVYDGLKRKQEIKLRFNVSVCGLIFDANRYQQSERMIGSFLTSTKFWNRISVHYQRNRHIDDRRRRLRRQEFCKSERDQYWPCSCRFNTNKERIMYDVTVNADDLKKIAKAFWKEVVQDTLDTSIKKSIVLLNRNAIIETPTDTWRLRNSFQTEFRQWYWRLFNPTQYAIFVQEWTKPHNAPFDPISWRAKRKWLNAWKIRRSIRTKGTKANPFMTRAIDESEREVDKIFQEEIDKLVLRFNMK